MQALEFEMDICGDILKIPKQIKNNLLNKHVKFIAMFDEIKNDNSQTSSNQEFWNDFIKDTAGSISDTNFVRPKQGNYEIREEF